MESQGQGDKTKTSPWAEWLTDILNDGVVLSLQKEPMGGRLGKSQVWGESGGI